MNIVLAKDHNDAMLLADANRVEAFGMDDILLYGLIATAKNPSEWQVVGDALQVEPYACMLRKDDPKFKAAGGRHHHPADENRRLRAPVRQVVPVAHPPE